MVLAVLSRLTAEGLQSDERYTESRIRYRLERGFGYHHIRSDLINKGVDPYLVDQMLHPDDDCWLLKARELIEKKLFLTEDVPHRVLAFAGPEHKNWHVSLKQGGFHSVISGLPGRRNRTLISELLCLVCCSRPCRSFWLDQEFGFLVSVAPL